MITESEIHKARILIVDDQESDVALLTQMLIGGGYTNVTSTAQPSQVCSMHRDNPYDLILLDLMMPEMDGFQVMDALRSVPHNAFLRVLVITAQPDHKLLALKSGARDFITKPIDLTELLIRVHNTLEVCMLYYKLEDRNVELEMRVRERTAELMASEARYRCLTELASDWYWEQDDTGAFTSVTGPIQDMLSMNFDGHVPDEVVAPSEYMNWDCTQCIQLKELIASRQPFLDFLLCRTLPDGSQQSFRVSGEPVFTSWNKYIGYRGVGIEIGDLMR